MEFSSFKLVIYGVIAVVLIWMLFAYILPFFFPEEKALDKMGNGLNYARINEGKGLTDEILFSGGSGFKAEEIFDTPEMGVVFQCNSPEICREETLRWDDRSIYFKEAKYIKTSFRCEKTRSIYACKIYFGEEPAQVEFGEIDLGGEIDLSKGVGVLSLEVKNTGEISAFGVSSKAKIYSRHKEGGDWVEYLYSELEENIIDDLEPGETGRINFNLGIMENGHYAVEVRSSAVDAGFDFRRIEFDATGAVINVNCKTAEIGNVFPVEEDGIVSCKSKYFCTGCDAGYECSYAWKKKGVELDVGDKLHAILIEDGSVCVDTSCEGVPCDDGKICTVDSCSAGVCSHPYEVDGTSCGTDMICQSGVCKAGTDPCEGVPCPTGQECVNGACQPVVSSKEFDYNQSPTLSASQVNSILASYNSPAQGQGDLFVSLGNKYNIDVVFLLGHYLMESTMGTADQYDQHKAIGNICYENCRCNQYCDFVRPSNGLCGYNSWNGSAEHFYCYIDERFIKNAATNYANTPDEILPIYAPPSENDTDRYIATIKRCVSQWRSGNYNKC
ncbi:MAG: hypothetical protein ABID38_06395 [Candidatus Diapherotrites archaeon]